MKPELVQGAVDRADGAQDGRECRSDRHFHIGGLIDGVQFVDDGGADPEHGQVVA